MKIRAWLCLLSLASVASPAMAQSSVTLYGILDESLRYLTNAGIDGKDQTQLGIGTQIPSRFGMKGNEDLGGGWSAVFRLESVFNLNNGSLSAANTLFSPQAYVGISSNKYGTLSFGRHYTPFFNAMSGTFDPMTLGDYWQDSWIYNGVGPFLTVSNTVEYTQDIGGLHFDGMYGLGNQAGALGLGSMYGVEVSYTAGPAKIGAGFQQNDVASTSINGQPASTRNGAKFNIFHLSGNFKLGSAWTLMAGWLRAQDQTGLLDRNMQQANAPTLPGTSPNRIDNYGYLGAVWQVQPDVRLTAVGYVGRTQNAQKLDGSLGSGMNYSGTIFAEYLLSKRTEVYATADFAKGNGAFAADYPGSTVAGSSALTTGRTNNVGAALGFRHFF